MFLSHWVIGEVRKAQDFRLAFGDFSLLDEPTVSSILPQVYTFSASSQNRFSSTGLALGALAILPPSRWLFDPMHTYYTSGGVAATELAVSRRRRVSRCKSSLNRFVLWAAMSRTLCGFKNRQSQSEPAERETLRIDFIQRQSFRSHGFPSFALCIAGNAGR